MKLFFAALAAASFIAPVRAEIPVSPIAGGTPGARILSGSDYCKNVFIKKSGDGWTVVEGEGADLKDDNVEKLRACLGFVGKAPVNAVVFSVDTRDTCATETRCVSPMVGPINKACTNQDVYLSSAPRKAGYFSCNSSFANRNFMGGLHFDAPISTKLLAAAMSSESIKAAATAFAQAQYQRVVASAVRSDLAACGSCVAEREAIKDLFAFFAAFVAPDDLATAGFKYIAITGARQAPEWMSAQLPAPAVQALMTRGEQDWRRRYAEKLQQLASPNSDIREIQSYIKRLEAPAQNTWASVDFDGRLPQLKQMLEVRLAQQQREASMRAQETAQAAERNRQAEARRVSEWRKTLQVGSDTFCGPVIEMRGPMVKIAVKVQLPGYSNEAWLKVPEVFPAEYDCRNSNGHLSTY